MNSEELAAKLNGSEYPMRIDSALAEQARSSGLVIVYGASDDLMEFEGAIRDEIDMYEGGTVRLDNHGIMPSWDDIDHDDEEESAKYFARRDTPKWLIKAIWDGDTGYSWTYKTDIKHAEFDIVEDGNKYCRGFVFSMADISG